MTITIVLLFILGLALLIVGAEFLVKGASRLAMRLGMTPLLIGLTIVAFGTSAPELAISVFSAVQGQSDIAFGNVVGSNIFNTLFILGACAAISPLIVQQKLVRVDVLIMIGASLLVTLMASDGLISVLEGTALSISIVLYTWFSVRSSRQEAPAVNAEYEREFSSSDEKTVAPKLTRQIFFIVLGLVLLVIGSRFMVDAASTIARAFGVSDLVIALTVIAAGTSLPEVATSIMAAVRGERDIAVGNVVGSNIFNLLCVLGFSSVFSGQGLTVSESAFAFDLPVMVATAIACLPIFLTGYQIARWEGLLFFGYYVAYVVYLILHSTSHELLQPFSEVMLFFVIPITAVTLIVASYRSFRAAKT